MVIFAENSHFQRLYILLNKKGFQLRFFKEKTQIFSSFADKKSLTKEGKREREREVNIKRRPQWCSSSNQYFWNLFKRNQRKRFYNLFTSIPAEKNSLDNGWSCAENEINFHFRIIRK